MYAVICQGYRTVLNPRIVLRYRCGILADSVLQVDGGEAVASDTEAVATKFVKNLIIALLYGSLVWPKAFSPLSYSGEPSARLQNGRRLRGEKAETKYLHVTVS